MKPVYTTAIVRTPGKSMTEGLTTASFGKPDHDQALSQHEKYVQALADCSLVVTILQADEQFPDSCFVEDVALCTPQCAVITRPGAPSRRGETATILPVLSLFYDDLQVINGPGTVEAGDIMLTEDHCFIGISGRTDMNGAKEMAVILERYGIGTTFVELSTMLHLKTGVAYLGNNTLLVTGELTRARPFRDYVLLEVPQEESYAANCILVNGSVIMPAGFPWTARMVRQAGYPVIEVEMSEFRKLDGGVSCLSLRF